MLVAWADLPFSAEGVKNFRNMKKKYDAERMIWIFLVPITVPSLKKYVFPLKRSLRAETDLI